MHLKPTRRQFSRSLLATAAIASTARGASAQAFPNKPIRWIVPYAPGGGTDGVSRVVAEHLGQILDQSVIVDNRAGAGGAIGTEALFKAPPDGYTIGLVSPGGVTAGPLVRPAAYDPRTFTYLTRLVRSPFLVLARTNLEAQSLPALIELVKRRPDEIRYASSGVGTASHLAGQLFNIRLGARMTHVPYRGTGPVLADLIAGNVDLYFGDSSGITMAQDGKVRLLGVTSSERFPQAPDAPAVGELIKDFAVLNWYGVAAPPGLPAPIRDILVRAISTVLAKPAAVNAIRKMGFEPAPQSPADFTAFVLDEIEMWRDVIKKANIKPE